MRGVTWRDPEGPPPLDFVGLNYYSRCGGQRKLEEAEVIMYPVQLLDKLMQNPFHRGAAGWRLPADGVALPRCWWKIAAGAGRAHCGGLQLLLRRRGCGQGDTSQTCVQDDATAYTASSWYRHNNKLQARFPVAALQGWRTGIWRFAAPQSEPENKDKTLRAQTSHMTALHARCMGRMVIDWRCQLVGYPGEVMTDMDYSIYPEGFYTVRGRRIRRATSPFPNSPVHVDRLLVRAFRAQLLQTLQHVQPVYSLSTACLWRLGCEPSLCASSCPPSVSRRNDRRGAVTGLWFCAGTLSGARAGRRLSSGTPPSGSQLSCARPASPTAWTAGGSCGPPPTSKRWVSGVQGFEEGLESQMAAFAEQLPPSHVPARARPRLATQCTFFVVFHDAWLGFRPAPVIHGVACKWGRQSSGIDGIVFGLLKPHTGDCLPVFGDSTPPGTAPSFENLEAVDFTMNFTRIQPALQLEEAAADGMDIRGLMYWTLVDNFEYAPAPSADHTPSWS